MFAVEKNSLILERLARICPSATIDDVNILRRAELTLTKWSEQECGDSNDFCSWSIERDEKNGKPYRCVYPHKGSMRRTPIADKERGALRRIKDVCDRLGLHFYHQTDPRGCALYVSNETLTSQNYHHGIAICV